jgi:hypothetical protein
VSGPRDKQQLEAVRIREGTRVGLPVRILRDDLVLADATGNRVELCLAL